MEMSLPRLVYSFASSFLKVALFITTVLIAYRANAVVTDTISPWFSLPFYGLAIFGSKCAGEAVDESIRRRLGWEVGSS